MNPAVIETDALIVGAGPAGLFQIFQLGLLEIAAQVVDPLPEPGGQCIALYPDKPIYDIPGIPLCTGRELVAQLMQQVRPFKPGWHLGQQVNSVAKRPDGRFDVATTRGTQFIAGAVIIAGGVGAFVPRALKLDGLAELEGRQFFYHLPDDATVQGRHIVVMGDEDPALRTVLGLIARPAEQCPASVTLMHRRDGFRADPALVAQMRTACAQGQMRLLIAQPQSVVADASGAQAAAPRLSALNVLTSAGSEATVPADLFIASLGLSPKLGPIAEWGLALEHKQVCVDPATCETSVPGIFAVGDVNTYRHKKKLILAAFYEATMAAWAVQSLLRPHDPQLLQYTTTSSKLHRLLGVEHKV